MNYGLFVTAFFYAFFVVVHTASPYSWVFNIEDYGADPTGARSSFTAIQTAINLAQSKPGGQVLIPPGNFMINGTLVVTNSITISGSNPQSSVISGNIDSSLFLISKARGVILENFALLGEASTTGVTFNSAFIVTVRNLQITNCYIGMWIEGTGNFDLMSVNIWAHKQYGIRMLDLNGDIFLDKVHINNIPNQAAGVYGMYLSNVSGAKVTNSDIIGSQIGVLMDVASSQPNPTNEWDQFLSVDCDTVGLDPWHIISALGLQLTECWSGTFLSGTGVWIGPEASQVSITNHQWQNGKIGLGNNAHGVSITGGIMGNVQTPINSAISGEPTTANLRIY